MSAYRITLSGLVCGTSSEQVRAKTLYDMFFIFLFFYCFGILFVYSLKIILLIDLGGKDRFFLEKVIIELAFKSDKKIGDTNCQIEKEYKDKPNGEIHYKSAKESCHPTWSIEHRLK